ncbi:metallopeptidase family protein [Demequina sp.]|uniref:metallopeptidase family protein n=1 Tax=Demequina sp. TaxID=2050685 RepID=UPI0025F7B011|nr:metallopeptidase family protein [Demequina sp.]
MSRVHISSDEFEELVVRAIDSLPDWTTSFMEQIAVLVRDQPPVGSTRPGTTLLGQFRGIPSTAHGGRVPGSMPNTITLFRLPILGACRTPEEVPARILKVLGHEVGHAMGISERELRELGWF